MIALCDVRGRFERMESSHIGTLGIHVRKEYRGRGVGKALLLRTIEACKGKFEIITLEVFSNNLQAKRLYEEVGFRKYGTLTKGVKREGKYIDMELRYLDLMEF